MKLFACVLMLAACGGGKSTTPVGTGPTTPAAASGPVYLHLFENATWTFTGETTTTPPVDMGPQTKVATPPLVCTSVGDMATKRATITCTGGVSEGSPTMGFAPMGTFVATDAGLWWSAPGGPAMDPAKLPANQMLIAATAAAHMTEIKDPENQDAGESYFAKQEDGHWCFGYGGYGGDEAGWSMCMTPDQGIVTATVFQAGATTQETKFTRK